MDYIKGMAQKLEVFEQLLRNRSGWVGEVVLVQYFSDANIPFYL